MKFIVPFRQITKLEGDHQVEITTNADFSNMHQIRKNARGHVIELTPGLLTDVFT